MCKGRVIRITGCTIFGSMVRIYYVHMYREEDSSLEEPRGKPLHVFLSTYPLLWTKETKESRRGREREPGPRHMPIINRGPWYLEVPSNLREPNERILTRRFWLTRARHVHTVQDIRRTNLVRLSSIKPGTLTFSEVLVYVHT